MAHGSVPYLFDVVADGPEAGRNAPLVPGFRCIYPIWVTTIKRQAVGAAGGAGGVKRRSLYVPAIVAR